MDPVFMVDGIVYNIRLHPEGDVGKLFQCDCGCSVFRQVTDIAMGARGLEVYECKDCRSWFSCKTIGEINAH